MKILTAILLAISLTSCEKIFISPDPKNDPETNFDLMWKTLNEKYASFDYKHINWDSVKTQYHKRITQDMSNEQLFDVLAGMLNELRDGHVNLISDFDISRNWSWYLKHPQNFNHTNVERNYLKDTYNISGPLKSTIIDSVGYIYYGSFSDDIAASNMYYVLKSMQKTHGVIIDVRDNGGGSTLNADFLAGVFADQKRLAGYYRFKSGPGHNDLTPEQPVYVTPNENLKYLRQVIVLTNRSCFSATNDFVLMMKALPNVRILGDSTGGGGGIPVFSELPIGWRYRFSSTVTLDPKHENVEGGIPPTIFVTLSPLDEAKGKDTMIERALNLLR